MSVEVFSYSVLTTVLGMLVVFASLTALSVMMVVLKAVFTSAGTGEGLQQRRRANAGKDRQSQPGEQLPVWVPAALAVYLAEEQEPDRPSADPWNAVINQYDPWVTGGRFSKRGV